MPSLFRHHDSLRLFVQIAQHRSFSEAAEALNMTKGAISYQVTVLESALGCRLFDRKARGVGLTREGQEVLNEVRDRYRDMEAALDRLNTERTPALTVGMSSYFASRWLSPRLMSFMQLHPEIQLRIQPMTQLFDLERQGVDIAIRWGTGKWEDVEILPFMPLPAWPVGNQAAADLVKQMGIARAFSAFTLLREHDNSNAWSDWFAVAGLPPQTRKDTLIIPDPNVRVQAVIDGQGVALNDALVGRELEEGLLVRLSDVELSAYGYFIAQPRSANRTRSVDAFVAWLRHVCPSQT